MHSEAATSSPAATPGDDRVTAAVRTNPAEAVFGRAEPTKREVRDRAYFIYLARGGTNGDSVSDWVRAERELREELRSVARARQRF